MASKIKITFLGTSSGIPTSRRNHTAIFLNFKNENILVDCGEGTQRQFRKVRLNPMKITRLLITHWHGDHVLGIPGLLQTLAFNDYNKKLFVYGPVGTKKFMDEMMKTFVFSGKIKIEIIEINKSGKFFETEDFYLEAEKMSHGTPCNAYSFVKKGQIRIDKDNLKKSKLPQGPFLKKLKEGENIVYEGKKYFAKDLTYKEDSKKISFILDTNFNDRIIPFVKNSDLLICESSFDSPLDEHAKEYHHLTSEQSSEIAKKSNSKKLVLTHISQRYDKNIKKFLEDSKKIFKNSFVAEDLSTFEVV